MKCPYCKKGELSASYYVAGDGKRRNAIVCDNKDCRCIWYGSPIHKRRNKNE